MIVAALDLGTNSFLCLVAEVESGVIKKILSDKVEIVRLGQDVNKTKRFHPEALLRADMALSNFKLQIEKFDPVKIQAYATSAARDVINKEDFFDLLKKYAIPLEIISGNKEAELTFLGGISSFPVGPKYVVVDIGGGSTEIIFGDHQGIEHSYSFNIGTVRTTEKFFTKEIPDHKSIREVEEYLNLKFDTDSDIISKILNYNNFSLVAVAGTPTEIAKIEIGSFNPEKIEGMYLTKEQLSSWREKLISVSHSEKINKYDVSPGRADVIVAGIIILLKVMEKLKMDKLKVSTKGLRFGIAQTL